MLDKERILGKIDELDTYLKELTQIIPANFKEYQKIEIKRSCERLLQLSIECVIDISKLFVSGLRLGLPSEENDLFKKLRKNKIISEGILIVLKEMRGLRNILVHEYANVDDEIIFKVIKKRLGDFKKFKREILTSLNQRKNK
ncbi:MAG: DUF86 domain-containing protein [Candidatus Omnitrophica bacterium]|nr:DUF86 domain-containing protein [Candidatus Omnitrophota bacterium]